jgi:hypothetical protein
MGEDGIFKQLSKALIERCLSAELDTHLSEERSNPEPELPRNRRNSGFAQKESSMVRHHRKKINAPCYSCPAVLHRDVFGFRASTQATTSL